MTFSSLLKSSLISLIGAAIAVIAATLSDWEITNLAKSLYLLATYSALILSLKAIVTITYDGQVAKNSQNGRILRLLTSGIFVAVFWVIISICVILVSQSLFVTLAERIEGWAIPAILSDGYEVDWTLSWFWQISLEKWWLVALLFFSTFLQNRADQNKLLEGQISQKRYERNLFRQYEFSLYSLVALLFLVTLFTKNETSVAFYYTMMVLFFLPWNDLLRIFGKVYDDFWDLKDHYDLGE